MGLYIAKSVIHGMGLFSDKQLIHREDIFINDFIETTSGKFINHADDANTEVIIYHGDVILKAIRKIMENEEITVNYYTLIAILNNDRSLIKLIRFW